MALPAPVRGPGPRKPPIKPLLGRRSCLWVSRLVGWPVGRRQGARGRLRSSSKPARLLVRSLLSTGRGPRRRRPPSPLLPFWLSATFGTTTRRGRASGPKPPHQHPPRSQAKGPAEREEIAAHPPPTPGLWLELWAAAFGLVDWGETARSRRGDEGASKRFSLSPDSKVTVSTNVNFSGVVSGE
jgi:hypothetical protein